MLKMKTVCIVFAAITLSSRLTSAQDLTGSWQGTLGTAPQQLRLVLHLEKGEAAAWKATFASIDQSPDRGLSTPVDGLIVQGATFTFAIPALRGSYDGTVATDGNSITGTWNQGRPLPLTFERATAETEWKDPSAHQVQFVTVESKANLEVLDWGGPSNASRTLVLVPGAGNTAHIFDVIAPKLAVHDHVIGVTRRGFGASSAPTASIPANYAADRLGDDVLAVVNALKITKPVLVGHSLGGEELSSIASRYPNKVAGLIYLDAGYAYAFYPSNVTPWPPPPNAPGQPILQAINAGWQKYTRIPVPVLAIYALPHDYGSIADPATRAELESGEQHAAAQAQAFEAGVPTARVVRIAHANHYVFLSNEADVLREVAAFLGTLR
jgi:non-heme chloroperoxidase